MVTLRGTNVLVTGGSGFIGSHLVSRLLAEGAAVAVLVRYANVIKNIRLRENWAQLHVIEADLRNRGALASIRTFAPEIVFHLAAYNHVGQSFCQVEECFDVNAKGTANLLDLCGEMRKFIYVASSEVYGLQQSVPFIETMQPNPMSPYAITKYAGELYCHMKQRIGGHPDIVLLRPFNAFGPSQSTKAVIPELILKGLRGEPIRTTPGEQTREFNFIANIVDGMLLAAAHQGSVEGPINLAGGEEVEIRALVQRIYELTGRKSCMEIGALPYRPNEIWRMYGDSSRARQLLGWRPGISFDAGLEETVAWYRDNGGSAYSGHVPPKG